MGKFVREFECRLNHEYLQLLNVKYQRNLNPSIFLPCQNLLNFIHEVRIIYQKVRLEAQCIQKDLFVI
jgi:hypothetical protein